MQVKQFRYYGEKDDRNYPSTIGATALQSGNCFASFYPIKGLKIEGTKGICFYVNSGNSLENIELSDMEHYEVSNMLITSLRFVNDNKNGKIGLETIFSDTAKDANIVYKPNKPYLFIEIYY